MGLTKDLGKGPAYLDTAPFIYFIEEHKEYLSVVESVFHGIAQGKLQAFTSALNFGRSMGDSIPQQQPWAGSKVRGIFVTEQGTSPGGY